MIYNKNQKFNEIRKPHPHDKNMTKIKTKNYYNAASTVAKKIAVLLPS